MGKHKYFRKKIQWEEYASKSVKPPFVPKAGVLYLNEQHLIESRNRENEYKDLELGAEDDIENFKFNNMMEIETDVVKVLEMKRSKTITPDTMKERFQKVQSKIQYGTAIKEGATYNTKDGSEACIIS